MNIQNYSSLDQINMNATTQLGPRQTSFKPEYYKSSEQPHRFKTSAKNTIASNKGQCASLPNVRNQK